MKKESAQNEASNHINLRETIVEKENSLLAISPMWAREPRCLSPSSVDFRIKISAAARRSGSYTVEASIVGPLLAAFLALGLFFLALLPMQWTVQQTLEETVRAEACRGREDVSALSLAAQCEAALIQKKLPAALIRGGWLGLDFRGCEVSEQELTAKVRLNVRFPVAFFGKLGLPLTASATAARWVGFDPAQAAAAETELVYITPYGEAWHRDSGCVYLNPSIRQVPAAMLSILRSRDGSIYYPCPLCHPERKGWVCLTDYGTNYHKDTACAGLHRTPQVVTMEEAQRQGYHKCPKCGGIDQDR